MSKKPLTSLVLIVALFISGCSNLLSGTQLSPLAMPTQIPSIEHIPAQVQDRILIPLISFVGLTVISIGFVGIIHQGTNYDLIEGEELIMKARMHWVVWLRPFFAGVLMLITALLISIFGLCCAIPVYLFMILVITKWVVSYLNTYLHVTNQRVIVCRSQLIRRDMAELFFRQVESLTIRHSVLERLFGCGTLVVTGSGGTRISLPYVVHPREVRAQINQCIANGGVLPRTSIHKTVTKPKPTTVTNPTAPTSPVSSGSSHFRVLVASLFRLQGYNVNLNGKELHISGNNKSPAIAFCVSALETPVVSQDIVHDLLTSMMQYGLTRGYVVTNGEFDALARQAAHVRGYTIVLINADELTRKAEQLGLM